MSFIPLSVPVFRSSRQVRAQLIVEAIGGEVTKESKVRSGCDNYDVRSMKNMKGGTGYRLHC